MIWAFEYLNDKQIQELKRLNPLMDFEYDFSKKTFYWQTFCAGFETIYKANQEVFNFNNWEYEEILISVNTIKCYPNNKDCIDNVPLQIDSYDYIINNIKNGKFQPATFNAIRVTSINGKYFTIDKSRLKAFRDAYISGYKAFERIPAVIADSLEKEIRKIKFFSIEQVRQGFICDNWEEAQILSMYLQNDEFVKAKIEDEYKWIKDYLLVRKDNIGINIIAIPVSIYLEHYERNAAAIDLIDLDCLMKKY